MSIRVPSIVRDVGLRNLDYAPAVLDALERLASELEADRPIPMLRLPAPDYDDWAVQYAAHEGETWLKSEWFFAEVYLYRLLIQEVRWWETGRDPFLPWKTEELTSETLWLAMDAALSIQSVVPEERLAEVLLHALWGNRVDLSLKVAATHGTDWHEDDLLADERHAVLNHLFEWRATPAMHMDSVHLVVDNAGSELAMDLTLAHALIETHVAERVILHVKLHPTFVSDATAHDVLSFMRLLEHEGRSADLRRFGAQLREMFEHRQLCLAPDSFWNSTRFLWEIPPRLLTAFKSDTLAIVKGDAHYRRMVGDALWNPDTPFSRVTDYFPIPLLTLRTLKSDTVVGLPSGLAQRLNGDDPSWRVNAKRGVIQFKAGYSGAE
jgi:hypothetical protein